LIHQLEKNDYGKVSKLIENTDHELFISAVITVNTPGEIYVDNIEEPLSTLIITPECNVVAGYANNKLFNAEIKKKLDFFDPVTCDTEEWEKNIHDIHCNIAMRRYKRRYYKFGKLLYNNFVESLDVQYTVEYVYADTLEDIQYENCEKIKDWFEFSNIDDFKDYCLGAYIRKDNKIVSWCLVDCIVDDKIEIGITTDSDFRRRGLGSIALAATVSACISKGIKEIGWHCVDTNVGSYTIAEKVGFKKIKEYSCFTPYPPIENVTDLNNEQWSEWGVHYEEMNKIEPKYHWQAAKCWALANNVRKTIFNINYLVESGQTGSTEYYTEAEEFLVFQENEQWKCFIKRLSDQHEIILE
jgi:RimJ/RimL family protein N-acetyltransferase